MTRKGKKSITRIPDPVDDRDVKINLAAMHSTVPHMPAMNAYTREHITSSIEEIGTNKGSVDFRPQLSSSVDFIDIEQKSPLLRKQKSKLAEMNQSVTNYGKLSKRKSRPNMQVNKGISLRSLHGFETAESSY